MTSRIVVLGASGRIGRMLRMAPLPAGVSLVLQTRAPVAEPGVGSGPDNGIAVPDWFQWDAETHADTDADPDAGTDPADPADALAGHLTGADVVLNLAGATPTRGAALDEAGMTRANVDLAVLVKRAAARANVPRVLMASSAAVYGLQDDPGKPIPETAPLNPQNAYGRSKVAMERAVSLEPGPETCCLRISTIAGADMLLQNAMRATSDAPLMLDQFADGRGPERSYIGPRALAGVLLALCCTGRDLPDVLNIADDRPVHMETLLDGMGAAGHPVHWQFRPAPPTALPRVVLDTTRLASLGLPPPVGGTAGMLAEALEFMAASGAA